LPMSMQPVPRPPHHPLAPTTKSPSRAPHPQRSPSPHPPPPPHGANDANDASDAPPDKRSAKALSKIKNPVATPDQPLDQSSPPPPPNTRPQHVPIQPTDSYAPLYPFPNTPHAAIIHCPNHQRPITTTSGLLILIRPTKNGNQKPSPTPFRQLSER
jgi:hypothetical protein